MYKIDSKQCAALSDEVGTQVPLGARYMYMRVIRCR